VSSPSADIAEIIGVEVFPGETIFVSREPSPPPDNVITVYSVPGGDGKEPNIDYERAMVQVRSRGGKGGYGQAFDRLEAAAAYLHRLTNYTTAGSKIILVLQQGSISLLEYDDNDRPSLSVDFLVHKTGLV
jgi:hypothetical protein